MSLLDNLLEVIAPHQCIECHSEGSLLCQECRKGLRPCSQPLPITTYLGSVCAATAYEEVAKALVWRLKYDGAQAAARIMAVCIWRELQQRHPHTKFLIIPVPTASSRVRRRGYDQAVLIARELSRLSGHPLARCLTRQGQTHQVGANRQQRLEQLAAAFRVKLPRAHINYHALLVDDVITTGATLEAAARALQAQGASHISAAVFAQA